MKHCENCGLEADGTRDNTNSGRLLCAPCRNLSNDDHDLRISPLEEEDLELVLAWRSNPEVYQYFREQDGPLEWEEHVEWFKSRPTDRYDFVLHFEGRRVGCVSISTGDEVGVYLGDFSARGQGVARAAITWLCDRFRNRTPLHAAVHEANEPSKALFERCGFNVEGRDEQWLIYHFEG